MSGRLSTHVLDTRDGRPAVGIAIELWRRDEGIPPELIVETVTNADGRTDAPLLSGDEMVEGQYEIVFHIGDYFTASGTDSPFLSDVPIRFHVFDVNQAYHVPLLCSPWAFSTYRGS